MTRTDSVTDHSLLASIRMIAGLSFCLIALPARAQVAASETLRLVATLPSPWGAPLGPSWAAGTKLKIAPRAIAGPQPLACESATHVFLRTPAAGLFEGNLPEPAATSAAALGMPSGIVTQRISCPNAGFDVHRAADGRAWLGLDNAVLRWERATIAATPESVVQALLVQHMAGDMGLSRESIAAQSDRLSPALVSRFKEWFARSEKSEEVPYLNGDPFTDSQEAPDQFELAAARVAGSRAELTVTFRGASIAPYPVHMQLVNVRGRWRIDDLRYRDGALLSRTLAR